jgi:transcriptional regulator with XRE-family HTH domain
MRANDLLIKIVGPLTVGMMLRNHRTRHDISQAELADFLGVTVGFISNIEK